MVQLAEVGVKFPVVFYNGERQSNVGKIEIHPTTDDYHTFRTMLKHMIGISYNNLTAYLVESTRPETQSERRKILITSKFEFSVLGGEKINAYFFVVVKRSRRDRRRRTNKRMMEMEMKSELSGYGFLDDHDNDEVLVGGYGKVDMWLQESNNSFAMCGNLMTYEDLYWNHVNEYCFFPSIAEVYRTRVMNRPARLYCEECEEGKSRGLKPEFHCCVYDPVFEGFPRTTAGPICRPAGTAKSLSGCID